MTLKGFHDLLQAIDGQSQEYFRQDAYRKARECQNLITEVLDAADIHKNSKYMRAAYLALGGPMTSSRFRTIRKL